MHWRKEIKHMSSQEGAQQQQREQLITHLRTRSIGSSRFVLPRQLLQDGDAIATQIHADLLPSLEEK
jgi:hypothetical protein